MARQDGPDECFGYAFVDSLQAVELCLEKDDVEPGDIKGVSPIWDYRTPTLDIQPDKGKYIYDFDTDVMHPFMMRSFLPFFKKGRVLELGSFEGAFTKRLLSIFSDITCVDASLDAITKAMFRLRNSYDKVKLIDGRFEDTDIPLGRYENIVIVHTLEHLRDPVITLERINDEWLSDDGRLFLVVPNANAPSRQIAASMGRISHTTVVTPAEAKHGHMITYTPDILEWDVRAAGLNIIHRSGIFFKPFASFQWDMLLQTDIISPEYLEGCYALGQKYPDLCSSIFFVCEKGGV